MPWAGIFGVGRRPTDLRSKAEATSGEAFRAGHYKDLTETGNRARKVSGTQGTHKSDLNRKTNR